MDAQQDAGVAEHRKRNQNKRHWNPSHGRQEADRQDDEDHHVERCRAQQQQPDGRRQKRSSGTTPRRSSGFYPEDSSTRAIWPSIVLQSSSSRLTWPLAARSGTRGFKDEDPPGHTIANESHRYSAPPCNPKLELPTRPSRQPGTWRNNDVRRRLLPKPSCWLSAGAAAKSIRARTKISTPGCLLTATRQRRWIVFLHRSPNLFA